MAEIKREPVKIIVGDVEYDAFDEDHTWSDVVRWALSQSRSDAEELRDIAGLILDETVPAEG